MGRIAVDLYAEQIGCTLAEAQTFRKYLGGCAGNIAVGLARLGLHSAMLSCIGQDEMGNFVKQTLQNEGVITDCLRATPDHLTGLAVLGVDPPEHFPLLFYRQNCADMQLQPSDCDRLKQKRPMREFGSLRKALNKSGLTKMSKVIHIPILFKEELCQLNVLPWHRPY